VASGQIDDGKPSEAETNRAIEKVALVVGTAMPNRFGHSPNRVRFDRLVPDKVKLTANTAHGEVEGLRVEGLRVEKLRSSEVGNQSSGAEIRDQIGGSLVGAQTLTPASAVSVFSISAFSFSIFDVSLR
jgi:hypothetical protein